MRQNAEEEYCIDHGGGGYYGDYMDEDDLSQCRDKDSDDEEERLTSKMRKTFPSGRGSHHCQ